MSNKKRPSLLDFEAKLGVLVLHFLLQYSAVPLDESRGALFYTS